MIGGVQAWLTTPVPGPKAAPTRVWFLASQAVALSLGLLQLQQAFRAPYVVQNDARQHVVWMERFVDPDLFPGDLIMDYYRSVAPLGYVALHWLMVPLGIEPLLLNKLLALPLALLTTGYAFGVTLRIFPVPAAAFAATVLLNQDLWVVNGLVNATPRAFGYPLVLAFLYYLLGRATLPCLAVIALEGLLYPQLVSILAGTLILRLVAWERWPPEPSRDKRDYLLCGAGLAVGLLVMALYALRATEFGPLVTALQVRSIPAFQVGRRLEFFVTDALGYWVCGTRTGLRPRELCEWPGTPVLILAGLLLPFLLAWRSRLPLAAQVSSRSVTLAELCAASLTMFFAAHALLFQLYIPSRYARNLWIALAVAAGITLVILLDAALRWAASGSRWRRLPALTLAALVAAQLLLDPNFLERLGKPHAYIKGEAPQLYEFFARQPKDILIASLAGEASNLPAFSKRSVLVAWTYTQPFHLGYYRQIEERGRDLLRAQYSPTLGEVRWVIEKYRLDYWVLDREAFTPEYTENVEIAQFEDLARAIARRLEEGIVPALATVIGRCSVLETARYVVLAARCILSE